MTRPYRTGLLEPYPYESHLGSLAASHNSLPLPTSVAQSCPVLCDPVDCRLPGSSVHGILSRQEVGCHALLQGMFPGIQPESLMSPALANRFFTPSATWETLSLAVLLNFTSSKI